MLFVNEPIQAAGNILLLGCKIEIAVDDARRNVHSAVGGCETAACDGKVSPEPDGGEVDDAQPVVRSAAFQYIHVSVAYIGLLAVDDIALAFPF